MRLGIFAKTFSRPSLEGVLDAVVGHGLDETQFNYSVAGLPSMPEENAGLHGLARECRVGLHRLGVISGSCERLGTATITLCTGTRDTENMWRRHPDNRTKEAWQDLLATMQEALEMAEEHGVTLAFERVFKRDDGDLGSRLGGSASA